MRSRFRDRHDAGRRLATELRVYANRPDVLVLALPRGGVPVGFEVAMALNVPLDVFVVRKLGLPWQEELAIGAIASGGVRVLDRDLIRVARVSDADVERVTETEKAELERQERQYRGDRPFPDLHEKTVILIDDGLATGSTMRAGVEALREEGPARIVVAVPCRLTGDLRGVSRYRRRHHLRRDARAVPGCGIVVRRFFADDRRRGP
jgi:putative phosphoribosyl transferase